MKAPLLPLLLLVAAPLAAHAQQSTGTIIGSLRDKTLSGEISARIVEISTDAAIETVPVRSDGDFIFHEVPFARYRVDLLLDSVMIAARVVNVVSAAPVRIVFDSIRAYTAPEVIVQTSRTELDRSRSGTSKLYTAAAIADLPVINGGQKIEAILKSTPGVVPDEDGRLHIRGEDAHLQYVIDGIPVTSNLTRVYSSLFDADLIKSVNVQTGGLNAEYGVAAAGVLALTTKSGFDAPYFMSASAGYGSFATKDLSVEMGGNLGGRVAGFFSVSGSESDRYLDPIALGDPIHDQGESRHYFGKINAIITEQIDLTVLGGYNTTTFSVPNSRIVAVPQDQQQDMKDYMVGARLNATLGENSVLSVLGYRRHASAETTSGGLMRIGNAQDSTLAVSQNEKFFIGADRSNGATGGQVEFTTKTDWFNADNTLHAGVGGEVYPLKEFFTFAVVNPALSDPNVSGGDLRYRPYDITQGGAPFLVNDEMDGKRYSGYVEDRVQFDQWTINAGIRFDMFDLFEQETSISPRAAAAYAWNDDLVLRASYSRRVMQAPIENILVSSSDEARTLTGAEQGTTPTRVRSEKAHDLEIGALYRLNEFVTLDFAGYGKLIDDFIVKAELGNSGIIFPINLKQGLVAGGELRADLHGWNNLSGFLAISSGVAIGMKPEDGSSPVAAGLILGEEGKNYSHPFAGEDIFPSEHNQILTAVMNLKYDHSSGFFGILGGRFDSGLPFDLADRNGVGLDPEASRIELKNRGYSDEVIDLLSLESEEPGSPDKSVAPHAVFDLAAGYEYRGASGLHGRLTLTATNILDTRYLYKFESSFGGTHFGQPRMLALRIDVGI